MKSATPKVLRRTIFGNLVLREKARLLSRSEILSPEIQELIANMRYTLQAKQYGVGLAAPQVGQGVALSAVEIKPTRTRPKNPTVSFVIINPEVVKRYGDAVRLWEGCISFGSTGNFPYAQAERFKKIRLRWLDERGESQEADFEGVVAHVLQHEVDHLNGILFVDRVKDSKTFVMESEFRKRYLKDSQRQDELST